MATAFGKKGNELHSPMHFHPGEMLLEEVEEREFKKADLAGKLGLLPGHLRNYLKEKEI